MTKPIAYCYDCKTAYFEANKPTALGPTPIYGPYGTQQHKGHDVRVEVAR